MSRDRPEWITCIAYDDGKRRGVWCGKQSPGFVFQSIDHAAYAGLKRDRLLPCPECLDAIIAALRQDDPSRRGGSR